MIGLYLHIPFCTAKCPYCDFYSVRMDSELAYAYAQAVIRNIDSYNERYDTVYFGGGTPSLLAWEISQMMARIQYADNAEITVEVNPGSASIQNLIMLKNSGVNRISIGVQSFSDSELISLGRKHTVDTAINSIRLAYDCGFTDISVDLMLAVPYQTIDNIKRSTEFLSRLPVTHVSAYMLKVEQNTPYAIRAHLLPDEDTTARIYLTAVDELEKNGFKQYEISNFAKPGFECKHNLKYWRCEEYLGIGAGAHSCYNQTRFHVHKDIADFMRSETQKVEITDKDIYNFEDYAMLKLRLSEGLSFAECEQYGITRDTVLKRTEGIPEGLINIEDERIQLTKTGFLLSNQIIAKIVFE